MANFTVDQADGLRRMLASPRPRRVTVLSTLDTAERGTMLTNLAVSLSQLGNSVALVDAHPYPRLGAHFGVLRKQSLLDVAQARCSLDDALHELAPGYSFASLGSGRCPSLRNQDAQGHVSMVFDKLAERFDTVLVDAQLDGQDELPVAVLDQSQFVVQVSAGAESIKAGYALIKRVSAVLGRNQFGVLVTQTEEARARLIYANLAQTAQRFSAASLYFMGSIPSDDHLSRAARLGRSVIEAFPLAGASAAFRRIAGQLSTL